MRLTAIGRNASRATLAAGTWGNYLGAVMNIRVTNSLPVRAVFFRLKQP